MINTCDRHDGAIVVYEGFNCPACSEIHILERDLADEQKERVELQELVDELDP